MITVMKKSTKGFYTLEAAIFLPFVILAVLSLGYFIRIEGTWENCIHGAVDESAVIAARSCNGVEPYMTAEKVRNRILEDNPKLDDLEIRNVRIFYSDLQGDKLISYRIRAGQEISFPLGFRKDFALDCRIKFRGFVGREYRGDPMGVSGLETDAAKQPVWYFPHSGRRYHKENCTYVKASVHPVILTESVKKRYSACRTCRSGKIANGSVVFCFENSGSSYHEGTCRTIRRRSAVIDKAEAEKKGYSPCSKCGGS